MRQSAVPTVQARALLEDFSLEMTGKDVDALHAARAHIPPGTRVNVTFLGTEDVATRVSAAQSARHLGMVPVPHVSARRLTTRHALEQYLAALQAEGASENLLVVGGDPVTPEGPYGDALALIRSGLLQTYGARHVSVAGYPEGHPQIADSALWAALRDKTRELDAAGLTCSIITQFGFDAQAVLRWIEAARHRGVLAPIRVGAPGPAGVRRLLAYAKRFGVGTSSSIAKKYGMSLTNLLSTTGPDRFISALADGYRPSDHGDVRIHLYTFGGLRAASEWVSDFRCR